MLSPSAITGFFQNGIGALKGGAAKGSSEAAQRQAVSDMLTLSSLAKQLDLLDSDTLVASGADASSAISREQIGSLKERASMMSSILQMKMSQFESRLVKTLEQNGVDTTQSLLLQDAGKDGVKLLGDHPQADKIRELMSSDPTLTRDFQEIARLGTLLTGLQKLGEPSGLAASSAASNAATQYSKSAPITPSDRLTAAVVATISSDGAQFSFE